MIGKRAAGVLAAGLLATGLGVASGPPAQAATGHYAIVNYGSGKCLEVDRSGAPSSLGGRVVQRTCDGQAVQRWSPVGRDTYTFVNQFSGMCVDVRNGVNADGTPLQQWACTGTSSMKWTVDPNSFAGCTRSSRRSAAGAWTCGADRTPTARPSRSTAAPASATRPRSGRSRPSDRRGCGPSPGVRGTGRTIVSARCR